MAFMNRKEFLKAAALLPLGGIVMKLPELDKLSSLENSEEKMPVMFIGHGSPMNAIELNEFSKSWQELGKELAKPKAILCISAHWETRGTFVTAMESPQTIHDFGGFPQALFDVEYPAPGNSTLAKQVKSEIKKTDTHLDEEWGLDHGCWSVIKQMYPKADV